MDAENLPFSVMIEACSGYRYTSERSISTDDQKFDSGISRPRLSSLTNSDILTLQGTLVCRQIGVVHVDWLINRDNI